MGRIYVLFYDYLHTSGNHAGMAHLARTLRHSNSRIRLIKHPIQEYKGGWIVALGYAWIMAVYLRLVLRSGDQVVFFEYLSGDFGFQDTIARLLRKWRVSNFFSGIVHLGGDQLLELYKSHAGIKERLDLIDRVLVFGSSLRFFLQEQVRYRGEVIQTFHYADVDYYKPLSEGPKDHNSRLQVLFLGAIKRNIAQLADIIGRVGDGIDFHICVGKHKGYPQLSKFPQVTEYGYLNEGELLELMRRCDVNLSVFYDTVGSNAITGTLAVGLAQVASHVGSIEDYGDSSNAIWCDSTADFTVALRTLKDDPQRLQSMKLSARRMAERISLPQFVSYFNTLFARDQYD